MAKRARREDAPVERVDLTMETVQLARIAQVIATNVRRGSHRKVNVYDHKSGEVLREAPLDEFYIGVAKSLDLTFSTREDAPQTVCAGWEGPCPDKARPPKWAFQGRHVTKRKGEPWRCRACGNRRAQALIDPSLRSEIAKARAAVARESWGDRVRKGLARMTDDERAHRVQVAREARSPESFHKAWATRRAKKASAE